MCMRLDGWYSVPSDKVDPGGWCNCHCCAGGPPNGGAAGHFGQLSVGNHHPLKGATFWRDNPHKLHS